MMRNLFVVVAALWAMTVVPAQAGCSRTDVEFYLGQGFGNDQIVTLCANVSSGAAPSSRRSTGTVAQRDEPVNDRNISREREEDEIFLRTAIEAYDVEIKDNSIAFTRKKCIEYGWKDWNGFSETACPHVRYTIAFDGLQVLDSTKEFYFFGAGKIKVSGKIREEVLNIQEFPEKHRKDILDTIKLKGDLFEIDVRSGMPIYKVEGMLRSLAT